MKSIGIVENPKHLSRDFLDAALKRLFDDVAARKKYGKISVSFQAGNFRVIEKQESITAESAEII
jgi:hypothetical protein